MCLDSSVDVDQRVQRELEVPSSWSNGGLDVDPSDRGTIVRNVSEETHSNPLGAHDLDTGAGYQDVSDESGCASDALHHRTAADRNARVNILGD